MLSYRISRPYLLCIECIFYKKSYNMLTNLFEHMFYKSSGKMYGIQVTIICLTCFWYVDTIYHTLFQIKNLTCCFNDTNEDAKHAIHTYPRHIFKILNVNPLFIMTYQNVLKPNFIMYLGKKYMYAVYLCYRIICYSSWYYHYHSESLIRFLIDSIKMCALAYM